MPDIEQSLKIFGQLIGLLDKDGSIQWVWFSDPKAQILGKSGDPSLGLPGHRQFLGKLIRSLKGGNPDDADEDFTDHFSWVPLNDGQIKVGFVWSKDTPDLQIGFGSQADFSVGGSKIDLAVLAKLIKIQNGTVTPIITDLLCAGKLPTPSFLKTISLVGETVPPSVTVDLTNKVAGPDGDRKLIFSAATLASPANESIFAWDCARIALFVLESWIHDKASAGGDNAFTRLDHHGFPMLGEPSSAIQPFPLFGATNMQKAPDFAPWRDSVIKFDSSTAGALAFLWHLRALVTGNENQDFLSGSVFMPLVSGAAGGGPPTTLGQATGTYDPALAHPAGVWIGLTSAASVYTLVIDIQSGTLGKFLRIPLAQVSGTTLTRPAPPSVGDLTTFLGSLPVSSPVKASKNGAGLWMITYSADLTDATIPFLNGTYTFQAVMSSPIRFEVASTKLPLTLTFPPESAPAPPSAGAVIGTMVNWVIAGVPPGAPGSPQAKLVAVAKDLGTFVAAEFKTPGSGKVGQLLLSIGEALADGAKFEVKAPPLDFTLELAKGNGDSFFHVKPGIGYGPLNVDQIPNFPISIGKLYASLDLAVDKPQNPLFGFSLGFDDLRLGDAKGGASGLIASLIPNLKEAPGFHLQFDWTSTNGAKITGGGKIPIQLTLGPLSLSQLMVDAKNSGLTIGINLTFQLSVITVSTYELGLTFDFKSNVPTPSLQGLGLSFNGAGIKLSGLFLNNDGDYIGGASVDIEDLFSLTAIGGYKQLAGGQASLFIFASLMAPLGGPPFFFVTGISGGFGYNRMLPPATLMANHPFFKIMSGELPISSDPKQGMGDLSALDDPKTGFAPKAGDYWIAAGIQFISFGFIHGKVVVAVAFGHDFSINILGIASFGISPVAYFEIDILVTVDAEKFLLVAGISKNSYLVHPDLFSLSGDFGLGVWHSGPHQGDFLLSIGGYHPYFKAPDYYPDLARVSVKAIVFGFVHLTVECFFACTPQALMAGASVSLSAEFAGIGAGLDVYIDVFIQWDPFFILASMGVDLWFEFLGRHEIGVDLTIHTPPFGGIAHISLFIVSFDVEFGDSLDHSPPKIPVADFFTKNLGVPATAGSIANDASVAVYNSATKAGLIRVVFTAGKTVKEEADTSKQQEGTDVPVKVSPEFEFLVRTHLPFTENAATYGAPDAAKVDGDTHLPLCLLGDLKSTLMVKITASNKNIAPPADDISPTFGKYPLANFGDAPLVAQGDNDSARASVAGIDTSQPAIELLDGLRFNLQATKSPSSQTTMKGPEEELSDAGENYPLPLGWPPAMPPVFRMPKSRLSFLASASANASVAKNAALLAPKNASRRLKRIVPARQMRIAAAGGLQAGLQAAAPKIVTMSARVHRPVRAAAAASTSVANPAAGVPAMQVPVSPARRPEVAAVLLRSLPLRTVAPSARPVVGRTVATGRMQAVRNILSGPAAISTVSGVAGAVAAAAAQPPKPTVTVTSGHAVHLEISSTNAPKGRLTFAGQQTVRAVFMTAFGEPVADQYVTGNQAVGLPPRARNVLLVGEGALAGAPASLGNIGAEAATTLYAIGPREFAGHGCVVQTNAPLLKHVAAGDTLTGLDVLPASPSLSFFFPAPQKGSSLVITLAPSVANPAPAPTQVRWRAVNATLTGLNTAASADHAAFVMDVQGTQAWTLDIDVTTDWDVVGVAVCNLSSAEVLTRLRNSGAWTFIDDRFMAPPAAMSTTVTLEVTNG